VKPLQRPVRVYLVGADAAGDVRSRLDGRLNFIGSVAPGRKGRGLLASSVPAPEAGADTLA